MKVYTQFVKDFPNAQELYESLKSKDKKFANFIQVIDTSIPIQLKSMKSNAKLIQPLHIGN